MLKLTHSRAQLVDLAMQFLQRLHDMRQERRIVDRLETLAVLRDCGGQHLLQLVGEEARERAGAELARGELVASPFVRDLITERNMAPQ